MKVDLQYRLEKGSGKLICGRIFASGNTESKEKPHGFIVCVFRLIIKTQEILLKILKYKF